MRIDSKGDSKILVCEVTKTFGEKKNYLFLVYTIWPTNSHLLLQIMFAQFCITRLVKIILPALLPQKLDSNFALNCTFVVKDYNDRGQMYCNIFTYLF